MNTRSSFQYVTRQQVIEYARNKIQEQPVYLDTETTGLEFDDEIIEIAIVDSEGKVIFDSFIKPQKPIPLSATAINHITNEMVQNSPTLPQVWPQIKYHLSNRPIGMYNAEFDIRMILQSLKINQIPDDGKFNAFDIMKVYSDFMGSDRRFRLEQAGRNLGIKIPNSHRAADDTLLTRAVFHSIAGVQY
jgi:DNA polymerase III alpha subunit (gram-positive type)